MIRPVFPKSSLHRELCVKYDKYPASVHHKAQLVVVAVIGYIALCFMYTIAAIVIFAIAACIFFLWVLYFIALDVFDEE